MKPKFITPLDFVVAMTNCYLLLGFPKSQAIIKAWERFSRIAELTAIDLDNRFRYANKDKNI